MSDKSESFSALMCCPLDFRYELSLICISSTAKHGDPSITPQGSHHSANKNISWNTMRLCWPGAPCDFSGNFPQTKCSCPGNSVTALVSLTVPTMSGTSSPFH
ncbi:hypothetical protein AMECASPLE_034701 [Ameca splendens]|uniref:Uncharacterized protein n=1 Tax=Ameca splendens TaxID=208324 RepID=A0ABV1ADK2_9TELE